METTTLRCCASKRAIKAMMDNWKPPQRIAAIGWHWSQLVLSEPGLAGEVL